MVEVDPKKERLYQWFDSDLRDVFIKEDAVTDCATICRLAPKFMQPCIGFALSKDGLSCTMLYNDMGTKTVEFKPSAGARVFSIEDCL